MRYLKMFVELWKFTYADRSSYLMWLACGVCAAYQLHKYPMDVMSWFLFLLGWHVAVPAALYVIRKSA